MVGLFLFDRGPPQPVRLSYHSLCYEGTSHRAVSRRTCAAQLIQCTFYWFICSAWTQNFLSSISLLIIAYHYSWMSVFLFLFTRAHTVNLSHSHHNRSKIEERSRLFVLPYISSVRLARVLRYERDKPFILKYRSILCSLSDGLSREWEGERPPSSSPAREGWNWRCQVGHCTSLSLKTMVTGWSLHGVHFTCWQ